MKIESHGNQDVEDIFLESGTQYVGKIRHISSLEVDASQITKDDFVDIQYCIADGEILNTYIAESIGRVFLVPQMDRDIIIPIPIDDFVMVIHMLVVWNQNNPGEPAPGGIEWVIEVDKQPVEFQ